MKHSHFSLLLLFSFSASSMYCMDGGKKQLLRTTSRKGGQVVTVKASETLEQFLERTKKLPAMSPGLFQDGKPRIQCDARNEKKIELGFTSCKNGVQGTNYIKIFDKKGKEIFHRTLDTKTYVAAALACNTNTVALIQRLMIPTAALTLYYFNLFNFKPNEAEWTDNGLYAQIISGSGTLHEKYELDPECGDFDIQGNNFIVWGTNVEDAWKLKDGERIYKIFNLSA